MRKIVSLLLCLMLVLSVAVGASAEGAKKTFSLMLPCDADPRAETENPNEWTDMLLAFAEKYPEYDVEVITAGSNSDDYNAAVQMAAAANNLCDLTYTSCGYVDDWTMYDLTMDTTKYLDEDFFAQFAPGAIDFVNQYNDREGIFGLPCRPEVQGWLYNTEMFAEYGLDYPETFEDFLNCVKTFKEAGITPISHGATDIWAIWGYHTMFNNNGLTYETAMQLQNRELKFADCVPFVQTFTHIAELAAAGAYADDVATTSNDIAAARFAAGESPMYCTYDSFRNNLAAMKETGESDIVDHCIFDFGPAFTDGVGTEGFIGNRSYGWTLIPSAAVESDADSLEAMLAFVKFFFSDEGTKVWTDSGITASTVNADIDTSSMDMLSQSIFAAYTEDIVPAQDLTQAWFDQSIKPTYRNAVTGLICGTLTVDEAIQMMQDWADTM